MQTGTPISPSVPNRGALLFAATLLTLQPGGNLYANAGYPMLFPHSLLGVLVVTPIVAILEKVFVVRAGVEKLAYLHSIIANSISAAIGFIAVPLVLDIRSMWMSDFGNALLATTATGLTLSVVAEGLYYCIVTRRFIRWLWVIAGNLLTIIPIGIAADLVQ